MQLTQKQINQAVKLQREEARKTSEYRRLTHRNFNHIKGYPDYKDIACDIAANLDSIPDGVSAGKSLDVPWVSTIHAMWTAYRKPIFPVYAFTKELCEDLLKTDLPDRVWSIGRPFDCALFLFPEGLLKIPEGKSLTWVLVSFLAPYEEETYSKEYENYLYSKLGVRAHFAESKLYHEGLKVNRLKWNASIDMMYLYNSVHQMHKEGDTTITRWQDFFTTTTNIEQEQAFTDTVSSLIYQCLLYMQITQHDSSEAPPKGFSVGTTTKTHQKRYPDPHRPHNYIWVGSDYKPQRRPYQGGNHSSPYAHPRRGHWRRLPWRQPPHNITWVSPCWVEGKED